VNMSKDKNDNGLGKCTAEGCKADAEWRDIQNSVIVNVCRKHIKSNI